MPTFNLFVPGLPRDGRDPVHVFHPPLVLHFCRPVLRHRGPAAPLQRQGHHLKMRRGSPGMLGSGRYL